MENKDVLSLILPKLDNDALERLALYSGYRNVILDLLSTPNHWYERAKYLSGNKSLKFRQNAHWPAVVRRLEDGDEDALLYIDTLDQFLVAVDLFGGPEDEESILDAARYVSDLDLFKYLLKEIDWSKSYWDMLEQHMAHKDIVDYILTIKPTTDPDENLNDLLVEAVTNKRIEVLDYLQSYSSEDFARNDILEAAIQTGDVDIFNRIVNSGWDEEEVVDLLSQSGNYKIFKYWVDTHPITADQVTDILVRVMSKDTEDSKQIVSYLESLVDIDWDRLAYDSVTETDSTDLRMYRRNALKSILLRTSPELDVSELLQRAVSFKSRDHAVINTLVLDDRMRVEKMPQGLPSLVFATVSIGMISNLYEYELGTGLGRRQRSLVARDLEGNDLYAIVLRQLVFKSVTRTSLLSWLIDLRSRDAALAAEAVLDRSIPYSPSIAPIRALLISMLYPRMGLREAITALSREGYREEVLAKTGGLLGLYYNLLYYNLSQ
ncbi:Hypothetical protein POVR2_LOCUS315 [uncultured virus]|nr:Hypothetical protein POVR2_LOCUS315 [uncultured virus]